MALNLGGMIRLTYAVKNDLGVAANPGTATLTITQPDGTTATPSVTLPPATTGLLVVDFTPSQAGLHSVHWATTGPTTAEDDVFVAERPASMLISVDEAVAQLGFDGITVTSDADREHLQWLCMVATDAVERALGRVIVRRTIIETYDGNVVGIRLRQEPIISVTSVVENGDTLVQGTDYFIDKSKSILYRGTTTSGLWWGYGRHNIVVTYVVGYTDPPRVFRDVALTTMQNLWRVPVTDVQVGQVAVKYGTSEVRQVFNSYRLRGTA